MMVHPSVFGFDRFNKQIKKTQQVLMLTSLFLLFFLLSSSVSEFACHISGCRVVFSTLDEYEHHYNSLHRHVCCSCRRSLPSARLLDIHIQEWHDSLFTILAQKQDMVSLALTLLAHLEVIDCVPDLIELFLCILVPFSICA